MTLFLNRPAVTVTVTLTAGLCATILSAAADAARVGQVQPAQPAETGEEAMVDGLREQSHSLATPDDLDPLLAMIDDRRAVLLGEASHGTEEYYAWRAEISKRLITEKDFRFIAVEGDWGACAAVNRYVKHMDDAPDSAREALDGFTRWPTWMWNNQVILELVEWLREHNADLPEEKRVGFYGIDVYGMNESLDKTPRYVSKLNADAARKVSTGYDCFRPYIDDVRQYLFQVQTGRSCEDDIAGVVQLLRDNREAWKERDRHAYFHAKQNALVVKNAERHYRTMIHRDNQSWNARARHFHMTLERLLDHYGEDSRGIAWAHNTHIGDARATPMVMQHHVNIGQLTRVSLGRENVALIGFSTHRGQIVAGREWEAPKETMNVAPAMSGSLEDILRRVSDEPFLFTMNDVRDVPGTDRRIGHRAIGVAFNPVNERRQYVPTVLTERYDAFIFIPKTTALREIENESSD